MRALLVGGDTPEAFAVARSIDDDTTRDQFFYDAAQYLSDKGAQDEALEATTAVEGDWFRATAVISVACALARSGEVGHATGTLDSIADRRRRAEGYCAAARVLHAAGQTVEAAALLEQACETAEMLDECQQRSWVNRTIAATFAHFGDLDKALSIADAIPFAPAEVQALVDLTMIAHEARNAARVAGFIEGALGHIEAIGDTDSAKVSARRAIAECMVLVGDERALATVESMPNDVFKVGALDMVQK